jgi:hypothetical protein
VFNSYVYLAESHRINFLASEDKISATQNV